MNLLLQSSHGQVLKQYQPASGACTDELHSKTSMKYLIGTRYSWLFARARHLFIHNNRISSHQHQDAQDVSDSSGVHSRQIQSHLHLSCQESVQAKAMPVSKHA